MRPKGRTVVEVLLVMPLLLALTASAQDYKIRAKVDLVEVPVTVKGSGDKLLTGLTKTDFILVGLNIRSERDVPADLIELDPRAVNRELYLFMLSVASI